MESINKWVDRFDNFFGFISAAFLFIMMIWIFVDVVLRSIFNSPIIGTLELTGEYLLPIIIFFAISYTQKHKGHVNVDLLEQKFPEKVKIITRLVCYICALAMYVLLGINNFQQGLVYFASDTRSASLLGYQLAPALMIISLGIFLFSIRILVDCINIVRGDDRSQVKETAQEFDLSKESSNVGN
ncbi:TRAP transporter small permease [Bacillus sp. B15-48]|uniref:TRAP transporter small permease n=1 Tax=Bacillus sp. B15-48 TaxID=1548601 RepID=UPI00193EDDC5|nr:TRAP transporter small permease [Bacillus sp. B15-48]MBM4763356.1 TRAP transporter small permease subunit [Bacillus sp. B15-48]